MRSAIGLILFSFFIAGCGDVKGRFFWAVSEPQEKGELERKHYLPKSYNRFNEGVEFKTGQKIWWLFRIDSGPTHAEYYISVSKKTFGWVEVFNRMIGFEPLESAVRDWMVIDEPGCYQLKIAQEGKIIDSIAFRVKERGKSLYKVDLDLDDPEPDEIAKFSRNIQDSIACP